MKRQLLFAMLCIVGALNLHAQTREVDMTQTFVDKGLTNYKSWSGASGFTDPGFCPMVTTNSGQTVQVCEKYEGTCANTGNVFYADLTGLTPGTYNIELYGGAAFTFNRGFGSMAFTGSLSVATTTAFAENEKIDPPGTGVTLYAQTSEGEYGGEIPIYYATQFPDGAATVKLENVVVGSNGKLRIGMTKDQQNTNWHVIQIKGVTALVALSDLVASAKADLQALVDEAAPYKSDDANLAAAVTEAEGYLATNPSTEAEADALIANMKTSIQNLPKLIATAKNAASVSGASANNPVTTNFVINGTFDSGIEPWQRTGGFQNNQTASNQHDAFSVPFYENWDPNAKANKMYQVIDNIPNGVYELDICAFVNNFAGDGQTTQYVFANDAKTYLTIGTPTAYKVFVEVTDNKIEVGLEQTDATANWMGIDNVSLIYYGNCTIAEAQFGSYIATVRELKDKIAAITALPPKMLENNNLILTAISDTQASESDYLNAINILTSVYDEAKISEEYYAEYKNIQSYVTAMLAVPFVEKTSGAHTDLETANVEPEMKYSSDIPTAIYNLNHAAFVYVTNADPEAGEQFDITCFLHNPNLASFNSGTPGSDVEGWLTEQDGGNFQTMVNNEMGPGGEHFMEYWRGAAPTSGFVLYQFVNLPAGDYSLTARVGLLQDTGGNNPNVTLSANNTDSDPVSVGPLAPQSLKFTNDTENSVSLGLKAHDGNTYHWFGINDMRLYKEPTATLDDYLTEYRTKYNEATAILSEKMNADVLSALQTAMVDESTLTTIQLAKDALSTLSTAVENAKTSVANYTKIKTLLDTFAANAANLDADGQAAYDVTAIQSAYDNGTLTSVDADDLNNKLTDKLAAAAKKQTTPGADMTYAIINPSFETGNYDGWDTTPSQDTGARDASNDIYEMSGSDGNWLFNTWDVAAPITQTLSDMPVGRYTLIAVMGSERGCTLKLTANNQTMEEYPTDKKEGVEMRLENIIVYSDGTLNISAGTDGTFWYKADNFRLIFEKPVLIVNAETVWDDNANDFVYKDYDYSAEGNYDVLLKRHFATHQWNTLVVPFGCLEPTSLAAFGADTQVYYADWFDPATNQLHFAEPPMTSDFKVLPNTPCIIKPTDEMPEDGYLLENRIVVASNSANPLLDTTPTYGNEKGVITTGNYSGTLAVPFISNYGNWVLGYKADLMNLPGQAAAFYYVDQSKYTYLHPTRAYFTVFGASATKAINFVIGDDVTGIATIENGEVELHTGKIYDLSGREVKNPANGLYIINGKKVMIK